MLFLIVWGPRYPRWKTGILMNILGDIANRRLSQFIGPGFDPSDAIKMILRDANDCLTQLCTRLLKQFYRLNRNLWNTQTKVLSSSCFDLSSRYTMVLLLLWWNLSRKVKFLTWGNKTVCDAFIAKVLCSSKQRIYKRIKKT